MKNRERLLPLHEHAMGHGFIFNYIRGVNLMLLKDDKNGRFQKTVHTAVVKALHLVTSRRRTEVRRISGNVISNQNASYNHGLGAGI